MKKLNLVITIVILTLGGLSLDAQNKDSFFKTIPSIDENTPFWAVEMYSSDPNVGEVQFEYEKYYKNHQFSKNIHTQNYKHWIKSISDIIGSDGHIDLSLIKKNYNIAKNKASQKGKIASSGKGTWTCIGPFETFNDGNQGGFPVSWQVNVYCIDQSIINPDILFAGTEAGGIFKTTDKGLNWFPTAENQPFSSVNDIKIAPSNDSIIYATAEDHIYKTIDGGLTWTDLLDITERGNQLIINKVNPDIIMCASDGGLFRSTDGGANWTTLFTDRCWDLENHPVSSSIVYLTKKNASLNRSEFFKSTDAGATWTIKTTGWFMPTNTINANDIGSRIAVTLASPDMVYVALIGEGKSTDSGWIGVYRSEDAGESWINPNLPDGAPYDPVLHQNLATINLDGTGFHQGFFNFGIAVSQTDAGKLWVGCLALTVSSDSASTWTRIGAYNAGSNDIGWIHPDIQDIHSTTNEVWISCDGGINYSTDDFLTHESRKYGISGSDYWGFGQGWNEDVMVGGRYHNGNSGYYQTYGIGNTLRLGGAEAPTGYVNPLEERKAYFSDISTKVLPYSIGGPVQSYGNLGLYPNESYYDSYSSELEFDPRYAHHLYIGKDGKIWKSKNEGGFFEMLYNFGINDRVLELEISRSNPDVMYCVLQFGGSYWDNCFIYRTADGGQTWTETFQVPANKMRLEISINPENDNELWVISVNGTNGSKVYRTIDGGLSWQNRTTSLLDDERLLDVLYQAGTNEIVYIASATGLFYWDVNSAEWIDYGVGLPLMTKALELKPFYKENKIRLATTGKGIWENDLVQPSIPLAQPMTKTDTVYCLRDTVQFDCYSILDHSGTTWQWSFNPTPIYLSSSSARNPKVLFGSEGSYDVGLIVTDGNGNVSSKTVTNMVTVINNCDPDTVPGLALECTNSGDYAITPNFGVTTSELTITAWVKPNGIQNIYTAIVINNETSGGFNFKDNNVLGYHWPGGQWWWNSSLTAPEGVWSHVALVITPDSVTIYCNGVSSSHIISTDSINLGTMSIGSYKGWGSRNYKGQIDEVCIWDRALSKDEIREIRHLTLENFILADPSVLAYYQFNEIGGGILDRVGIRHANITGSAFRNISTAPLGSGVSERLTINNYGVFDITNVGVSLEFPSTGLLPDGEIVVTRINNIPNLLPNNNSNIGCYYIINNYGTNIVFSPLSESNFSPYIGEATNDIINLPSSAVLYSRSDNDHLNSWVNMCSANTVIGGLNSSFNYDSNCNISEFGQFIICSDNSSINLIDNGIITIHEDLKISNRINIYPNPTVPNSMINVEYLGKEQISFKIYSESGKLIKERQIGNSCTNSIIIGDISAGVYFIVIESAKFIEHRKLVIN